MRLSQNLLCDAPSNDEDEGNRDEHRNRNVADARIDGRRNCRRQARIEYAFDAETQPGDDSPYGIDDGRNARICGSDQRQALLDGA